MDKNFRELMIKESDRENLTLTDEQISQFFQYYEIRMIIVFRTGGMPFDCDRAAHIVMRKKHFINIAFLPQKSNHIFQMLNNFTWRN